MGAPKANVERPSVLPFFTDLMAVGKVKKTTVLVGNLAGFAVNRIYFLQCMVIALLTAAIGVDL